MRSSSANMLWIPMRRLRIMHRCQLMHTFIIQFEFNLSAWLEKARTNIGMDIRRTAHENKWQHILPQRVKISDVTASIIRVEAQVKAIWTASHQRSLQLECYCAYLNSGAQFSAVGWGTALKAEGHWLDSQWDPWKCLSDLIRPTALCLWGLLSL